MIQLGKKKKVFPLPPLPHPVMIQPTLPLTPPPTDRPKSKYIRSGDILLADGSVETAAILPIRPKRLLDDLKNLEEVETCDNSKKKKKRKKQEGVATRAKTYKLRTSKPNSVLNIDSPIQGSADVENLEFLRDALSRSKNIVVVAGAGISTYAGIPDFRSKDNGLYTAKRKTKTAENGQVTAKREVFDLNYIYSSERATLQFNDMMVFLYKKYKTTPPSPFHLLLDTLACEGRLKRLYTQNIDSLETKLPHLHTVTPLTQATRPYPTLIQLHGSIRTVRCSKCQAITEMVPDNFLTSDCPRDSSASLLPPCTQCQEYATMRAAAGLRSTGIGYVRPTVTLFNEVQHPDSEILAEIVNFDTKYSTRTKKARVDCLIIVGTTLAIPSVRKLCLNLSSVLRKNRGGPVFFVSNEMPSKTVLRAFRDSGGFDLIVLGDCQKLASLL